MKRGNIPNKVKVILLLIIGAILILFFINSPSLNNLRGKLTGFTITEGSGVSRSFYPSNIKSGEVLIVDIAVSLTGNPGYHIIDETIPEDFTIIDSGGGNTGEPNHIKWISASETSSTIYTYQLIANPITSEQKRVSFDGTYFVQGMQDAMPIEGQKEMIIGGESYAGSSSSSGSSSGGGGGSSGGGGIIGKVIDALIPKKNENQEKVYTQDVVSEGISFKIIEPKRIAKDKVRIKYSIKEYSGKNREVKLDFSLFILTKKIISSEETKTISANSEQEYEKIMTIDPSLEGKIDLLVKVGQETYHFNVGEETFSKTHFNGFSIFGENGLKANLIIIGILGFVIIIGFVIIKMMIGKSNYSN